MNYKDKLLKIRALEPTEKILAAAKKIGKKSSNTRFDYDPLNYIFYRSCIENGILKISLFLSGERSEEHTSELQSRFDLVCRLLLEKKKYQTYTPIQTPL